MARNNIKRELNEERNTKTTQSRLRVYGKRKRWRKLGER
jgi:hypothetical protein